jgi:putative ABC transport system substrate-binding protein
MIGRREFITLLGAAAAWPLGARAQQPAIPVIGYLFPGTREEALEAPQFRAFHESLAELGYVEGMNILIEYRYAEGRYERLPDLAAELVRRPVAVIVTAGGTPTALAAKSATKTIPILFGIGVDPTKIGLVRNLSRPEGNLTGMISLTAAVVAKRLELLHALLPDSKKIALLTDLANAAVAEADVREMQIGAHTLGLDVLNLTVTGANEIDTAFAMLAARHADGLVVSAANRFRNRREQIVALAARYAIPTIYPFHDYTEAGGLMGYGSRSDEGGRLEAQYVSRILKGERPSDLPVQQQTRIELSINMKTAKTLGLTFPITLLGRADEVIE